MALHREVQSRVRQESEKVVIVGIDFGTSFTKVCFNQGGNIKQPLKFNVDGKQSYFLPTELYYDPTSNKVFFNKVQDGEVLRYFKYSMIKSGLLTSESLAKNNLDMNPKAEFLCSIYYLASLIKEIKRQIADILGVSKIRYSFNMGCPIDNWRDKNKDSYDIVLKLGYKLSEERFEDGMALEKLYAFYAENKDVTFPNLQTVPELYAEALWFIEKPSTGEGFYTILDIGGGTVDFATIYVSRTSDGEKQTKIYSQKVLPLGVEILLQFMYPDRYETHRAECIAELKNMAVNMPYGWKESEHGGDRKLKKAHEFDVKFAKRIGEVKERNRALMDEQFEKGELQYYAFGGGADFKWYHSIIKSHNPIFKRANIPPLEKQPVILNGIPDDRLIIAEQLTRSSFPEINGFPWEFARECIFGDIERNDDDSIMPKREYTNNHRFDLEDRQKEIYGD